MSEADFTLLHADKQWQALLDQIKRNKLPDDWFRAGSKPTSYQMFLDAGAEQKEELFIIKSTEEKIDGFGTRIQIG